MENAWKVWVAANPGVPLNARMGFRAGYSAGLAEREKMLDLLERLVDYETSADDADSVDALLKAAGRLP